jgi:hypothetical protein
MGSQFIVKFNSVGKLLGFWATFQKSHEAIHGWVNA